MFRDSYSVETYEYEDVSLTLHEASQISGLAERSIKSMLAKGMTLDQIIPTALATPIEELNIVETREQKKPEYHGMTNSVEYKTWHSMIDRCYNEAS